MKARSVLDCGDLSPLSIRALRPATRKRRHVGALQTLARSSSVLVCFLAALTRLIQKLEGGER